ncbi:MAG: hypothetical protein KAG66_03745, partial [Methylococcales bacterium]|nr:hypothetical protein [Methylococcales bacterium]
MSFHSYCVVENCKNSRPAILGFELSWTGGKENVSVHNNAYICMPCINELHNDATHQEHIKDLMI